MKKKGKRIISLLTALMFLLTLITSIYPERVQAYSNSKIFSEVKVGLVSMSNTTLTAVLYGNYSLNGTQLPSGTVLTIKTNNNLVNVNGTDYAELQLQPLSPSNLLVLTSGTYTYRYQGSFSFKVSSGKVFPINSLDLESYLKGVVGYEMSDYFPIEALKAQAVASRNYALSKLGSEASKGYDFDDTILYQVYKGYDSRLQNVIRAVDETKYILLLYNDQLVEALYSASHGGYTEDAVNVWGNSVAYLKSKPDSFENDLWPYGNVILSNAQMDSTLKARGLLLPEETFVALDLDSITRFTSGRVSSIAINYLDSLGAAKIKTVTKDRARTFLGLPSSMYNVTFNADTGVYTFSGKGYGHGLGMSQIGAKNRAASGQTYEQILKFYYDGTYLANLSQKASISSFTVSSGEIYTNSSVNINTLGTGGSGQYLYRYQILRNGTEVFNNEFSEVSSLTYKTVQSGSYEIVSYIKDKYSSYSFDEKQSKTLKVSDPYSPRQISSAKSSGKMLVNTPIDISADIRGGSPSGYSFRYVVQTNGRTIAERSLSSISSFSFTPSAAGKYTVSLYVKDNVSVNSVDASKTFDLYINASSMAVSKLPIKSRMKGNDVRVIQSSFSQLGYNVGAIDGSFGTKTLNAVKSFQRSSRLRVTGIVDSSTFNAMNNALLQRAKAKVISY